MPSRKNWVATFENGQPLTKDGCGVFGILRKNGSPKIGSLKAVEGIACIKYRGSNLGAGYASFNCEKTGKESAIRVKAFVNDVGTARLIEKDLEEIGDIEYTSLTKPVDDSSRMAVWQGFLSPRRKVEYAALERAVDGINYSLIQPVEIKGRIISYGKYLNVYKEVGYPKDVARLFNLDTESDAADLWIAHTRQPTNSPGELPIWSHPFASSECAIVHNGDISSFGANIELLNTWGIKSHVGTDSEVVARLLDHLIRVEGLSIRDAATVLTNSYERHISKDTLSLLSRYKGARLDGPFAVVAGYCDGEDVYLIALTDRSKFRPLLIGEDESCYYVASEENQIRSMSLNAKVWTPEPGSFFIASLRQGLIEPGTTRSFELQDRILRQLPQPKSEVEQGFVIVEARGSSSREINAAISGAFASGAKGVELTNASGERFIGIGISTRKENQRREFTIRVSGLPGNCLANLNDGATFEVLGNAADDVADTMHSGRVIIHGNARDVLGQALQGGDIFVRGCVGNRAAIQMREYRNARPFVIVGESADDYLGEYMAGGVACVLNMSDSPRPTGNYVGTGMVGGVIYVRGKLEDTQIGLLPQRLDVLGYLGAAVTNGMISKDALHEIESLKFPSESYLKDVLPASLFARVKMLFFSSKYPKSLEVEHSALSSSDLELLTPKFAEFFRVFSLDDSLLRAALDSEFTIIRTKEEKVERPVPPQEVPVEE